MRCSDEVVKLGPGITRVAEVFLDAFEVARLVTVIRSGRVTAAVGNVRVEIIDWRRNPDGGYAQAREVRHLLLNAREDRRPSKHASLSWSNRKVRSFATGCCLCCCRRKIDQ